ncbi:conserved Plasmodium protein, unknown function [Plasmodium knowlesi strain H]|uniref:ubiquitinyl hydrolase 1 n=3 Tax=Plasmodium knowlesi TaxID=5850 RepID=A0A5E7WZ56_PLAKH|nr:Josephin domain-containing protein, putative [Plasmodium knowlesi strain H]OTN65094.1 Uncharacterized protein PKNOH_S120128000 [Plasmodium knowlesi]CAA9988143.1 Josephin domain-containing protein, putative [Plasmodium knowlesi strain H]SBO20038.1 conserved Plasmodium protein, unknown function [Plasmodium knowlesi strain H]SBO20790.1 conserved Plasmodium protein, unknown function [Plasmodium knowlesi strain H]VVS77617.1 Josephin domain-containing protein, putative [Plasmodium knowlesi strain
MCHYETHAIETERGLINVYFERQSKLYCLLHTANNILQAHVYSPDDFKDAEIILHNASVGLSTLSGDQADDSEGDHADQNSKNCYVPDGDGNRGSSQLTRVREKESLKYNNVFTYIKRGFHYFGNFNINILYFFMNKHNIDLQWIDNKQILRKINNIKDNTCATLFDSDQLNDKKLIAFVVNIVRINLFDFYQHRHFYTIRKISGMWFQLDSTLSKPVMLPTNEDLNNHLFNTVKDNKFNKSDNYIIQVFKRENNHDK